MALLLPALCFAIVAAADFSRGFSKSMAVAECARAGAVFASRFPAAEPLPIEDVRRVAQAASSDLGPPALPPVIEVSQGIDQGGSPYVEVTATIPFAGLFSNPAEPLLKEHAAPAPPVSITRTVRMRRSPL